VDTARFGRRPPKAQVAETEGFNLYASVVVGARDVVGRERLLRYVARPAVAIDRVAELPDGRIAWRLNQPGGRGETHRIMDPVNFMARLVARGCPEPSRTPAHHHAPVAPVGSVAADGDPRGVVRVRCAAGGRAAGGRHHAADA
jgi:hypothetical protein